MRLIHPCFQMESKATSDEILPTLHPSLQVIYAPGFDGLFSGGRNLGWYVRLLLNQTVCQACRQLPRHYPSDPHSTTLNDASAELVAFAGPISEQTYRWSSGSECIALAS